MRLLALWIAVLSSTGCYLFETIAIRCDGPATCPGGQSCVAGFCSIDGGEGEGDDAAPATHIALTSGNGQNGTAGSALAAPFIVTARDANDNPVADVAVGFVVTAGGGRLSAASVATNAQGQAQATLTLGTTAVTNTAEARAPGLNGSPLLFAATKLVSSSGRFAAKVDFPTGENPTSVAIGDLDGDGKLDLAVANIGSGGVSVLLGTTAAGATVPSFAAKVDFPTGSSPKSIAIGDLNADGKLDLTVANELSNSISVLLGATATGAAVPSFAATVDFLVEERPLSVAIGDLNADGKLDLAVVNDGSGSVSVLFGTTATGAMVPSFAAKVDFPTGSGPKSIAMGDLNGDGKLDLTVATFFSDSVAVLLGTTAAGAAAPLFAAAVDFPTESTTFSVAIGDLNTDGKLDLAVANYDYPSVLLSTTAVGATVPSFAESVAFPTGSTADSVAVGDLNGDGKLDLAVADSSFDTVSILLGTTAAGATVPSFAATNSFPTGLNPDAVAIDDLNGDGKLDLSIVNYGDASVSVLLGQ